MVRECVCVWICELEIKKRRERNRPHICSRNILGYLQTNNTPTECRLRRISKSFIWAMLRAQFSLPFLFCVFLFFLLHVKIYDGRTHVKTMKITIQMIGFPQFKLRQVFFFLDFSASTKLHFIYPSLLSSIYAKGKMDKKKLHTKNTLFDVSAILFDSKMYWKPIWYGDFDLGFTKCESALITVSKVISLIWPEPRLWKYCFTMYDLTIPKPPTEQPFFKTRHDSFLRYTYTRWCGCCLFFRFWARCCFFFDKFFPSSQTAETGNVS